jgi:hypothetical protein
MTCTLGRSQEKIGDERCTKKDKEAVSSPTSVLAAQGLNPGVVMEPIVLGRQQDEVSNEDEWICPASAKSMRTINPIRAIVDPFVKNIQTGEQRGDGKDLISLAVSITMVKEILILSC